MKVSLYKILVAFLFLFCSTPPLESMADNSSPESSAPSKTQNGSSAQVSASTGTKPLGTALMTGGVVSATLAWGYYAWWYGKELQPFSWRDTGWFGEKTYAGGADKMGHFYAFYLGTYIFHDFYSRMGVRDQVAIPLAGGLTFFAANLIELADAFTDFGFEYSDVIANSIGVATAMLDLYFPEVGDAVGFRIGWIPSRPFLKEVETYVDLINDYTGMTVYADLKFKGISLLFNHEPGYLTQHLLAGVHYNTEGYSPSAPAGKTYTKRRNLGIHFGAYMPEFFRSIMKPGKGRKALEVFTEFYALPFTLLELTYDLNHKRPSARFGLTGRIEVAF